MIVNIDDLKRQLNITQSGDDVLLQHQIEAAQARIERTIGFAIEDQFTEVPADLKQAVLMLAAHWYENREATLVGVSGQTVPLGVRDITDSYRHWWGYDPNAA